MTQPFLFDDPLFQEPEKICTVAKDTQDSGLEAMEDRILSLYRKKICRVIEQIEDVGLPAPGEQLRLITRRTFNAVAFLSHIAKTDPIEDLKLVVYSINHAAALLIADLLNAGLVGRAEILISNLRNTAHTEKEELTREIFARHPRITLWFCSSHAKVMSCRTRSGQFYTVEGLGNLAFNSRLEQYVIDNDEVVYEFTAQWMADIRRFLAGRREFEDTSDAAR